MSRLHPTRRTFLQAAGATVSSAVLSPLALSSRSIALGKGQSAPQDDGPADYTLTIATKPIELAPNRILSAPRITDNSPARCCA
jgi:hypothetical protein